MKVLVAGIIARYPFGGVTWCSLMYLLGLRALGHEVLYIEDTGECIYDPEQNTRSEDPSYGTRYIHNALQPFGLGDRWSFVNYDGSYHGVSHEQVRAFCADAELFINLSGGSWFWRDEYLKIPRKVFIDTDPVFTQLAIAKGEGWYVDSSAPSIGCSRSARTSARRRARYPTAASRGTRRGNRSPSSG